MGYQQTDRVNAYLTTLHEKLVGFYTRVKHGDINEAMRSQSQGYIQAGIVLAILEQESARACMEKAHFEVFQQTIDERLEYKKDLLEVLSNGDDTLLDEPAITRKQPRMG